MAPLQKLLAAIIVVVAGIIIFLSQSDTPGAEIGRSFLATRMPSVFGGLRDPPALSLASRLSAKGFTLGRPVLVRIFKEENLLELWMSKDGRYELALSYPVCAWSGDLGPKEKDGDRQSPEGYYFVSARNLNPNSHYYRAINVGFPNAFDQALQRTGSALMIHGSCVSAGCYAITDVPMDDIYNAVVAALSGEQESVPLHIYPFRLSAENLERHKTSRWIGFWQNLAEGDKLFSATKQPPDVSACGGKYAFGSAGNGCTKVTSW